MGRILSLVLVCAVLCSMGVVCSVPAYAADTYSYSFEGSNWSSGWGTYGVENHKEGVMVYSANTDKAYVTDGEQSFYILDTLTAAADSYTGVATPYIDISGAKKGDYKLTVDARVLSGTVTVQLRYYFSDNSYVINQIDIGANSAFEENTIIASSPYDAVKMRALIVTKNASTCEAYLDNLKIVKTADIDAGSEALYHELKEQLSSATAGTVIEIDDGVYENIAFTISASGTQANPITIKAKNPGKVVLKKNSWFTVTGDYVNIEGLRFEECNGAHAIRFDLAASNCQLKDCAIYNSSAQYWVMLRGRGIKVSGCMFDKKSSKGQILEVSKDASNENLTDDHIVENCFFGNIAPQSQNAYEAIRIGSSTYCFSDSNTTILRCFFYKCDGEVETISVKSCGNTIKNNTFYNNKGAIVLRHGNDNDVFGNLFVGGEDTSRITGVRVIGERHSVHDNYFYNLPDKSTAMILFSGCPYEGIENHYYYPVVDAKIYNNTVIGGGLPLQIGDYSPNANDPSFNKIIAPDGDFFNNAIVSYSGTSPLIVNNDKNHTVTFSNNVAYGKEIGYKPEGVSNEYFELERNEKYFKPSDATIGADIDKVKNAPVNPYEILSSWMKTTYFDTGVTEFNFVSKDPFNTDSHLNDVIPFDVSYGVSEGDGTLTLTKDGVAEAKGSLSVSGNPKLVFTAAPGENEKISSWYVNGIPVTEGNIENLGVVMSGPAASSLVINDLTGKFDIEVEFAPTYKIPDTLESPLAMFKGTAKDKIIIKNHEGKTLRVDGRYAAVAAKIPVIDELEIKEYGFLVSSDGESFNVKAEALLNLTSDGAYGMLFYGFKANEKFYIKPYAIYFDSNKNITQRVEGEISSFISEE